MHARKQEFEIGKVLAGTRYRVLGRIGAGGMGTVYDVEHVELGKRFVLKALHGDLARRPDLAARLRNEWRALGRLEHPNIVTVTDAGTSASAVPFYVMERLEGETLAARLRRERRLLPTSALDITIELLEGLDAAHRIRVVHRDIKPPNIFLLTVGGVKLLDFGVAKLRDGTPEVVTARGMALGTPRYMAPEQVTGGELDARTDLYAVGLVLYEMLAGCSPFEFGAAKNDDILVAQLTKIPPRLSHVASGILPELDQLLAALLAKDAAQRPGTAAQVSHRLRNIRAQYRHQLGAEETVQARVSVPWTHDNLSTAPTVRESIPSFHEEAGVPLTRPSAGVLTSSEIPSALPSHTLREQRSAPPGAASQGAASQGGVWPSSAAQPSSGFGGPTQHWVATGAGPSTQSPETRTAFPLAASGAPVSLSAETHTAQLAFDAKSNQTPPPVEHSSRVEPATGRKRQWLLLSAVGLASMLVGAGWVFFNRPTPGPEPASGGATNAPSAVQSVRVETASRPPASEAAPFGTALPTATPSKGVKPPTATATPNPLGPSESKSSAPSPKRTITQALPGSARFPDAKAVTNSQPDEAKPIFADSSGQESSAGTPSSWVTESDAADALAPPATSSPGEDPAASSPADAPDPPASPAPESPAAPALPPSGL